MNLTQLKKIVAKGESSNTEFKKSTGLLDAAFKTACAFLNSEGGIVLIGVGDKGNIVGQEISDKTRQEIAKAISELEPPAQSQIAVNYISIGNKKHVIAIRVEAGSHIPYTFEGRAFHRIQSTSPRMPQHRYEQLIIKRGQLNHAWDEIEAVGYKIDKLDHDLILSVVNEAVNNKALPASAVQETTLKILERLKLIKKHQILNAAATLFGKNLFPDYPQCQIKLARFKGAFTTKNTASSAEIYASRVEGSGAIGNAVPIA